MGEFFCVQYARNQSRFVEEIDDQFSIEPGIDSTIEHLLNDVINNIMQEIVQRVFKEEILRRIESLAEIDKQKMEALTTTDRIT